jgi:protein-S-isoprenylcysteine O-methyltransferase Ste14
MEKLRLHASQIFAVMLGLFISVSQNSWGDNEPFASTILFTIGIFLVGIGSLGRLWCSLYIAGYKKVSLITEGPYSMCRNPLYFFSFLGAVGVGLATETLLIPTIILVAFTIYYPFVVKSEEVELRKLHGQEFAAYFENVPRFFPNISMLKEPEKYTVNPVIFKRHMFDALWFVWLVGIMEIIESLHEQHIIPVMFNIY